MPHVSLLQDKKNINVQCPDGFANQLRFALAGVYLKLAGYVDTYNIDWVLNNHNNVDFKQYFEPLPEITFNKIINVNKENIIDTSSFKAVIECLSKKEDKVCWRDALETSLNFLKIKPNIQNILNSFLDAYDIKNSLGLHVRRTCKQALLKDTQEINRSDVFLTNEQILSICESYTSIYLATDNRETQQWFKTRLKDKLITFTEIKQGVETFNGKYNRDLVERYTTPLNTVLDFLILKECNTFLGTSESSLSLLIKYWRNNKIDYPIFGRL